MDQAGPLQSHGVEGRPSHRQRQVNLRRAASQLHKSQKLSMYRSPRVLGIPLSRSLACARSRPEAPTLAVETDASSGPTATRFAPRVSSKLWDPVINMIERSNVEDLRQGLAAYATQLASNQGIDALSACSACLLLADLGEQGWAIELHGREAWVSPPMSSTAGGESPESVKSRLRAYLRSARSRQLQDPAVRAFIERMETPRIFQGKKLSILSLVDDGHELAVRLEQAARLPPSERLAALKGIVQPIIAVVEAGQRCESTGLDLMDIWRYFRHTWSLEYRPTPGRTLMFMIRNAARPGFPVMAIGALANATLQLKVRDDWIGWTPVGIAQRLSVQPQEWPKLRTSLLRTLEDAQAAIRSDDLLGRAGVQDALELEARLMAFGAAAAEQRQGDLQGRAAREAAGEATAPIKQLPLKEDGSVDWRAASELPLFVAKRARNLAEVLFARRVLSALPADAQESLDRLTDPDVVRAISIASREIRKVGLASRLLELNVCGAVPPYGDLLAGKLAALAAASGELREAYERKYSRQVSEIASQMAGRAIVRQADICLIATTSLYGVSASQYNRLKLNLGQDDTLEWVDRKVTKGYGTTHLAEETIRALRALSTSIRGGRNVNNVFGEGASPRLRQTREGLDALGLDADALIKHNMLRRVYVLEAFKSARDCLRFNEPGTHYTRRFGDIADAWMRRWLVARVTFTPALDRTRQQGAVSLATDLRVPDAVQQSLFDPPAEPVRAATLTGEVKNMLTRDSNVALIAGLYRATGSCADHHDAATVRLMHIETAIDEYLRTRAPRGGVVFVTGNPGDGKTHLLRRLDAELRASKMEVVWDANEASNADLIEKVDAVVKKKGKGLAIAINEGVLIQLLRDAADRKWAKSAMDMLLSPYIYRGQAVPADPAVTVLDLNLRNNLAPAVVRKAMEVLAGLSGSCPECPGNCSLQRNVQALSGPALERLIELLGKVARTGLHATMRDLEGLLAYLLVGPLECAAFVKGDRAPYWVNAFEGANGPLFDALRRVDPQFQPAPFLDDQLWRAADTDKDWIAMESRPDYAEMPLEERRLEFVGRKRRAFFEHTRGDRMIASGGSAVDRLMSDLLTGSVRRSATALIRLLNKFFDRSESRGDSLYLWVTHRFDAQASRFAAVSQSVAATDFEIVIPRLRPELKSAFPDFLAPHVMLCLREQSPSQGLRVDRALVEALVAAEMGMPSTFRRGEPEARIAAFFDRVSKLRPQPDDLIEVRVVDTDTGASLGVGIDVAAKAYTRS